MSPNAQELHHNHDITRVVYTRLPREIRDVIYANILTQDYLDTIFSQRRDELSEFYIDRHVLAAFLRKPSSSLEDLELSKIALFYRPFAAEMLDMLCEMHPHFRINTPSELRVFLNAHFFGAKPTPRHAKLSKLHIRGSLDEGCCNSVNVKTIASDFRAFSDCTWAPNLKLSITFNTELGISTWNARAIPRVARKIHAIWQILLPWIIDAEKRGARVCFTILTTTPGSSKGNCRRMHNTHGWVDGEHDMFDSEAEWVQELTQTLGPECRWFRRKRPGYTPRRAIFEHSMPRATGLIKFLGGSATLLVCVCCYLPYKAVQKDQKR